MSASGCPICLNSVVEHWLTNQAATGFTCEICGQFKVSSTAQAVLAANKDRYSTVKRAALSYRLRRATDAGSEQLMVTSDWIEGKALELLALPTPAQQATNIIRFVGDETSQTGNDLDQFPESFHASIGAPNREFAMKTVADLVDRGWLNATRIPGEYYGAQDARLTLAGWERYEAERQGETSGNYGFMAMQFGNDALESFLSEHIRPAIHTMGYELNTTRDKSRAGIIDNLMRIDIRDSAFVLVDLTHDNRGAYWEAGYAEGLGKPVLYICEKSKFEDTQTHFDTNHSTTVCWNSANPAKFKDDLIATLRRSLKP